jgi:4-amino-4-deoxy-L-arabinose transferase
MQRSDITLYDQPGEVQYGLSYPDARDKFVSGADFPAWLAAHRRTGDVTLVLSLSRNQDPDKELPKADFSYRQGRLALFRYSQTP